MVGVNITVSIIIYFFSQIIGHIIVAYSSHNVSIVMHSEMNHAKSLYRAFKSNFYNYHNI